MRWEEVQSKGEIWRWEDGESFDEDVGDSFVAVQVWIELISKCNSLGQQSSQSSYDS